MSKLSQQCMSLMEKTEFPFFDFPIFRYCPIPATLCQCLIMGNSPVLWKQKGVWDYQKSLEPQIENAFSFVAILFRAIWHIQHSFGCDCQKFDSKRDPFLQFCFVWKEEDTSNTVCKFGVGLLKIVAFKIFQICEKLWKSKGGTSLCVRFWCREE